MSRARQSMAILVVAVAAVAGAYALGSSRAETGTTVAARTTAAESGAPESGAPESGAPASAAPSAGTMNEASFWRLVADTRTAAGNATGRQSELLEERLRQLPAQQIADFARIRRELDRRAYTWDIWGAAYVIEDGCSDDCFRDFRGYLISLGKGPYETAMRDPDMLAPIVQDAESGDWENADDVAGDAYESVADEDIPGDSSDLSGDPSGTPWDDDHAEALVHRYPRLAARFR